MPSAFNIFRHAALPCHRASMRMRSAQQNCKKIMMKVCRYSKNVYLCEKIRVVGKIHR